MGEVRAFWWSPRRDRGLGYRELRRDGETWLRLWRASGHFLINFGDEMTPMVVSRVLGVPVQWSPTSRARLLAVGSILEFYAKRSAVGAAVWGTGLRSGDLSDDARARLLGSVGKIIAVRGPLTRHALGLADDHPIGDPGVLAPAIVSQQARTRSGRLYLPHFRSWATADGRRHLALASSHGWEIVPPAAPPEVVLERIAHADFVLSSSLHGIVVAHSYGVPVRWIGIPGSHGALREPDFKYRDYFASINRTAERGESSVVLGDISEIRDKAVADTDSLRNATGELAAVLESALRGSRTDLLGPGQR